MEGEVAAADVPEAPDPGVPDGCHEGPVGGGDRTCSNACGGPPYMYAGTCGNRLDTPDVAGDRLARLPS